MLLGITHHLPRYIIRKQTLPDRYPIKNRVAFDVVYKIAFHPVRNETVWCHTTRYTPAYVMVGGVPRTIDDVTHALRSVIISKRFVDEATPQLFQMTDILNIAKEQYEEETNTTKSRMHITLDTWYLSQNIKGSNLQREITSTFLPKRAHPTSYAIESMDTPVKPNWMNKTRNILYVKFFNKS